MQREKAILRIVDLCYTKNYRYETIFQAIALFDQIMIRIFDQIVNPKEYIITLVVAVTIIAAKME